MSLRNPRPFRHAFSMTEMLVVIALFEHASRHAVER